MKGLVLLDTMKGCGKTTLSKIGCLIKAKRRRTDMTAVAEQVGETSEERSKSSEGITGDSKDPGKHENKCLQRLLEDATRQAKEQAAVKVDGAPVPEEL